MIQFDSSHMLSYLKTRKKGTAGGCDGWTYDLILSVYNACQGTAFPGLWDDFAAVLCLLANNLIPDSVRSLATDTRCIGLLENRHGALEKLRLLGLPSALVNLMQGAVAAKYKDRLLEVAAGLGNLACSVPAGTEVYAATARAFLAKHRSGFVFLLDEKNAFGLASRERILQGIRLFECEFLEPIFELLYRHPSDLLITAPDGEVTHVPVSGGAFMGSLFSGLFYAMTQFLTCAPLTQSHQALLGPGQRLLNFAYADDSSLLATQHELAINLAVDIGHGIGQHGGRLNQSKTVILCGDQVGDAEIDALVARLQTAFEITEPQARAMIRTAALVAGIPVGHEDFINRHLRFVLDALKGRLSKLVDLFHRYQYEIDGEELGFRLLTVLRTSGAHPDGPPLPIRRLASYGPVRCRA